MKQNTAQQQTGIDGENFTKQRLHSTKLHTLEVLMLLGSSKTTY